MIQNKERGTQRNGRRKEVAVSSRSSRWIFTISAFIFGLLAVFYILSVNYFSIFPEKTDFYKFYQSAKFFTEKKSIYKSVPFKPPEEYLNKLSEKTKLTMKTFHPNLNAPFHTLFILPLGILPFRPAFWVWSVFSFCLSLMAVGLIAYTQPFRDYQPPMPGVFRHREKLDTASINFLDAHAINILILWIVILGYYPSWINIISGQFGLFLLGSIVLIWLTSRKGKCRLAGIILGIAISIKIFMGLFLIFFLVQRRWKILFWSVSIFIFCNFIALITFGLATYKEHLEILALSPLYINASWNASFSAFFSRILGGAENIPLIELPMAAYSLAYGLSILLTIGLIRVSWPRQEEFSPLPRFDIGFSLTIISMLLISPFGWIYYFPVLIVPLLVAWHIPSAFPRHKLYRVLLIGTWILSSIPTAIINSEETAMNQPIIWFTSAGYYFYALIAFCGILFIISHRLSTYMTSYQVSRYN